MWTFQQINEELGELVLRDVVGELNNLICGFGPGERVNRSGINTELWSKLLRFGGVDDEGISLLLSDASISQCHTIGPFTPFTITTIHGCAEGENPLLSPAEMDDVIRKILTSQGRLTEGD